MCCESERAGEIATRWYPSSHFAIRWSAVARSAISWRFCSAQRRPRRTTALEAPVERLTAAKRLTSGSVRIHFRLSHVPHP